MLQSPSTSCRPLHISNRHDVVFVRSARSSDFHQVVDCLNFDLVATIGRNDHLVGWPKLVKILLSSSLDIPESLLTFIP